MNIGIRNKKVKSKVLSSAYCLHTHYHVDQKHLQDLENIKENFVAKQKKKTLKNHKNTRIYLQIQNLKKRLFDDIRIMYNDS